LSNSLDRLSKPRSSGFIFKLPPDYGEGYSEIVRMTVLSFIMQQKVNFLTLKTISSLSSLFKILVDNIFVKTHKEDQSIDLTKDSSSLNSEVSLLSSISNKMEMFICNNCIQVLIKLGIISDINCTPIEVIRVSDL
jgi:hypothetical protein